MPKAVFPRPGCFVAVEFLSRNPCKYVEIVEQYQSVRGSILKMLLLQQRKVEAQIAQLRQKIQADSLKLNENLEEISRNWAMPKPLSGPGQARVRAQAKSGSKHRLRLIGKKQFLECIRAEEGPVDTDARGLKPNFGRPSKILHLNLSSQHYLNFANLFSVLSALFQNAPVRQAALDGLRKFERRILRAYLMRKRLLKKAAPWPCDAAFYSRPNLFRSAKRKEEKLKFVLSAAVKHLRLEFDKTHRVDFEAQVQSSKSKEALREAAFYDGYFGPAAEASRLPISAFYLPGLQKAQSRQDHRPKTISKKYVRLLKQSQPFLRDLRLVLRGQYTGAGGEPSGIEAVWRRRLLEKLKNKMTSWNLLLARLGRARGLARICADIETNKRHVMPWSKWDVRDSVRVVEQVFFG